MFAHLSGYKIFNALYISWGTVKFIIRLREFGTTAVRRHNLTPHISLHMLQYPSVGDAFTNYGEGSWLELMGG